MFSVYGQLVSSEVHMVKESIKVDVVNRIEGIQFACLYVCMYNIRTYMHTDAEEDMS